MTLSLTSRQNRAFWLQVGTMCLLLVAGVSQGQQKADAPTDAQRQSGQPHPTATMPANKAVENNSKKQTTGKKTKNQNINPEPRRVPDYSEILKALQQDSSSIPRPITPPRRSGRQTYTIAPEKGNAIRPLSRKLLPDGSRIVDRPGRLTREANYFTFAFESRGKGVLERPMRLLPNRLLEDMEIASAGGSRPIVFVISGEVTEYRGVNYLLVQKLLVRPNLGNLK